MAKETGPQQKALFSESTDAVDARIAQTEKSMLWAAYADALGFVSELVNARGLKRRIGREFVEGLASWKHRVGGRSGVIIPLPAGCWSDDTQLRMAVSRSINHHGFDVETFARIELPVWPSYALGGGRASKAAARKLANPRTLWYANTFRGWCEAGGNGAAMRIQPHVWSSPDLEGDYMLDVIKDSVCTHGHPRAIVGACFHASTLAHCIRTGTAPTMNECDRIAAGLADTLSLMESHSELGGTWVGLWERETSQSFSNAWQITIGELRETIEKATHTIENHKGVTDTYLSLSKHLGLRAPYQRGSGILTSVAAAFLAAAALDADEAVKTAANALGTDTDTIATMVGALLGACTVTERPPDNPLDSSYLLDEATRLAAVSRGDQVDSHRYPDILTWSAPLTQADALVINEGQIAVEGLGSVKNLENQTTWTPRKNFGWQWVQTDFGQTLLIKRRPDLRLMKPGNTVTAPPLTRRRSPDPGVGKTDKPPSLPSSPSQPEHTLNAPPSQDIISPKTRRRMWDLVATHRIKRTIPNAFETEGFAAGARASSQERWEGTFHAYDTSIDWADPDQVLRALRVFETLVSLALEEDLGALRSSLEGDGYTIDNTGLIRELDTQQSSSPTNAQLSRAPVLEQHLRRLFVTSNTDPTSAIRHAASLMKSTAKYVLEELGEEYNDEAALTELADLAQKALNIHSDTIDSGNGSETIVSTLSHISHMAIGVAELLNQSKRDDREDHAIYSLKPRHARLAVGGAQTYCHFLLDTLRERRREILQYGRELNIVHKTGRGGPTPGNSTQM